MSAVAAVWALVVAYCAGLDLAERLYRWAAADVAVVALLTYAAGVR